MTKFHHQLRHTDAFLRQNADSSVPWLRAAEGPKVLILSSRMAWNWFSLGLCHQSIEKSWLKLGLKNISVQYKNAESLKIEELIKSILVQEIVVILQPSADLFKALSFARENGWKGKCIFYSFADASLFGFPFSSRETLKILRSQDQIMVLCEADKKIFSELIPNFQVNVVDIFHWKEKIQIEAEPISGLAYYGRISLFKNIHYLIFLLWKLNQEGQKLKLHLFGDVDSVSSHVLGMKDLNYRSFLEELIIKLKLEKQVVWHGSVAIEVMTKKHRSLLFLSPSTHRDENFGWAPREIINEGLPILLSDWGGYKDLLSKFPKSTYSLPLKEYKNQIIPDFVMMLKTVKKILKRKKKAIQIETPSSHLPAEFISIVHSGGRIEPSSLVINKLFPLWDEQSSGNLVIQDLHLLDSDLTDQIFTKYYRGEKSEQTQLKALFPWVEINENTIEQKAPVERSFKRLGERLHKVSDLNDQKLPISEVELNFLIENGLLF